MVVCLDRTDRLTALLLFPGKDSGFNKITSSCLSSKRAKRLISLLEKCVFRYDRMDFRSANALSDQTSLKEFGI